MPEPGERVIFEDGQTWDCVEVTWRSIRFQRPDDTFIELSIDALRFSAGWKLLPKAEPSTRFDRVLVA